jgi:hypothetical protein
MDRLIFHHFQAQTYPSLEAFLARDCRATATTVNEIEAVAKARSLAASCS